MTNGGGYEVQELSGNYRLSDINAALEKAAAEAECFYQKRLKLWSRYAKLLHNSSPVIDFVKPHQQDLSC